MIYFDKFYEPPLLYFEKYKGGGFCIVIYLDILFGINFLMDFIVLLITVRIMNLSTTFFRLLLSTTFGAIWSVIAVVIPDRYKIIVNLCTYLCISFVMIVICAGFSIVRTGIRKILKCTLALLAVAMLLAGGIHMIMYYTYAGYIIQTYVLKTEGLLAFTVFTVVLVTGFLYLLKERQKIERLKKHICITIQGRTVKLDGFIDTGNMLCDCITGKPVTVVERDAMKDILENINDYTRLKYHFTPYNTVSGTSNMMEIITAEYMYIQDNDNEKKYENVLIGLANYSLSDHGEFQALINPNLVKE